MDRGAGYRDGMVVFFVGAFTRTAQLEVGAMLCDQKPKQTSESLEAWASSMMVLLEGLYDGGLWKGCEEWWVDFVRRAREYVCFVLLR